jgi:hypothetical protein
VPWGCCEISGWCYLEAGSVREGCSAQQYDKHNAQQVGHRCELHGRAIFSRQTLRRSNRYITAHGVFVLLYPDTGQREYPSDLSFLQTNLRLVPRTLQHTAEVVVHREIRVEQPLVIETVFIFDPHLERIRVANSVTRIASNAASTLQESPRKTRSAFTHWATKI